MTTVIGIDPGVSGAIAVFHNRKLQIVYDIPSMPKVSGKGNQINSVVCADMLRYIGATIYIEKASAMPGQGVVSMFNFGKSVGIIEGIIASMKLKMVQVSPAKWKKYFGLTGKDKQYSISIATQLFPDKSEYFNLKKHHNRADAALIGWYGINELQK